MASLRGEIDAVVVVHVTVWALAGLWLAYKFYTVPHLAQRMRLSHKLGLGLVAVLALSTMLSPAPVLSAFKTFQFLVCILFTYVFVERYGVSTCMRHLLWAYTLLGLAVIVSAVAAPEIVYFGVANRLRGDLLAPTGTVAAIGLALLLTIVPEVSRGRFLLLLPMFVTLAALSRTRTAYIAIGVLVVMALLVRPKIIAVRRSLYALCVLVFIFLCSGLLPTVVEWLVREPESIADLSGRFELWPYLANVTLHKSPLIGLGYYAAARILSLEVAPNLGSAHSAFLEILVGGGVAGVVLLTVLCGTLIFHSVRLLLSGDRCGFAAASLLPIVLLMASGGWGDFDSGPVALTFWCLCALLPALSGSRLEHRHSPALLNQRVRPVTWRNRSP